MTKTSDIVRNFCLHLLACLALAGCISSAVRSPDRSGDTWFRGNTHAHTELSGHGDASPEFVAKWYHDRGYNFLVLSEHNKFIDPKNVTLPVNKRDDFILIPGQEISGAKAIHVTALNARSLAPWEFDQDDKSRIVQFLVDSARGAAGEAILNHPNYKFALTEHDILPVSDLYLFELFNGHNRASNFGDTDHQSTEALWDKLLTAGMRVYGVSSDDSHIFHDIGPEFTNPGRGWVGVKAPILTPDAITSSMRLGQFYASNGVYLEEVEREIGLYSITVNTSQTEEELTSPTLRGRTVTSGNPGYRIQFIGPGGIVLSTIMGSRGSYSIESSTAYVRAKVTYTRPSPNGQLEEYFAWGQPIFTDDRKDKIPED